MSGIEPKTFDDLYIDDEGDDDIQLADEASGLGPLKSPGKLLKMRQISFLRLHVPMWNML